jgi:hypothetical protein
MKALFVCSLVLMLSTAPTAQEVGVDVALLHSMHAKRDAIQRLYDTVKASCNTTGTDCERMNIEEASRDLVSAEISIFSLEMKVGRRHKIKDALSKIREKISDAEDAVDDLTDEDDLN